MSALLGEIRRFIERIVSVGEVPLRMTGNESLAVAQMEPSGFELTRAGRRFFLAPNTTITGIANVTALPTTAAQWVLYNADTTKTYFFESLGAYVTEGTPGVGGFLVAATIRLPVVAAPGTQYAGLSVVNANLGSSKASRLSVKASITVSDPALPNWHQVAENTSPNVGAFPGSGGMVNRGIGGRICLPPGFGLALCVVGLAGTSPKYAPFAEWTELESDNE